MISYRVSVEREAPLNLIPTLPYKPNPACKSALNFPSPRSVVTVKKRSNSSGSSIEESRRGVFSPPRGDFRGWWNPACFVWVRFLSFFFDEHKPLGGTIRAHSNQSQPPWETNVSHGGRYAATHGRLSSFPPVPHLFWEYRRSEVSPCSSQTFQINSFKVYHISLTLNEAIINSNDQHKWINNSCSYW